MTSTRQDRRNGRVTPATTCANHIVGVMNIGTWLRGARLADGTPADVRIKARRIAGVVRDPLAIGPWEKFFRSAA